MAKKKLPFEVLLSLLVAALVFAALSNIGWYRIADWLFVLGIIFLTFALGIYVYLYTQKKYWATTLKENSSSLRNIFLIILVIAYVVALAFSIFALVFLLANILG
ncbi:MAG: hypothetical protein EU530_04475 [Promethearchaeota archaeon]|nr:MAG: hypothetical protein EU530_04475 [Candidatus Lokiarchaeota archaeon]